ncbi:MAG: pyridoxamine 5'-phosphate oxidase family protein [Spirochaetota bacterium]
MRRSDRLISDREELNAIIGKADACRLAFAVAAEPYLVTLNFGFEWLGALPILYFHCARQGRKLDMMRANPRVCFELDIDHELVKEEKFCDWGMRFASVVGYGILDEVPDDAGKRRGLDIILRHYGGESQGRFAEGLFGATTLLRLRVDELTGKRKA